MFHIIEFFIIVTDERGEKVKLCFLCQDDFSNPFILMPDKWTDEIMTNDIKPP